MSKVVKRGFIQTDDKEFSSEAIKILQKAGCDLYYLLNNGYHIKGAAEFVGNHYLLSARQRLALIRSISSGKDIQIRKDKEIDLIENSIVNIDGFNTIITLEVAFSNSLLLKGMDGTFRDMAGLRGNYRLIDKTDIAIQHIGKILQSHKIKKAIFYLDAPISNSGKLRERILSILSNYSFETQVYNINNVDSVLERLDNVVTSDAIILDKCKSWINMNHHIILGELAKECEGIWYIDFNRLIIDKEFE
jgi:hypothetical protein